MKFHTKKASFGLCIVFLAILLLLTACGNTPEQETPDTINDNLEYQEDIDLDDLDIQWVTLDIEHEFLRFEYAGEGLYLLEAIFENGDSQFGFMDGTGTITIPVAFDHANTFTDGLAYVESGGRNFFIDPTGAEAIDLGEVTATPFEFGFARIAHTSMQEIEGGVALVHSRGLIDISGDVILPTEFDDAGAFENGILWAVQDGQYAIFDSSGEQITPHEFDHLSYAGENLIIAQRGGKSGHIDRDGSVVTPFDYDTVGSFSDERALVIIDGLSGYVDLQGELVIPLHFAGAEHFSEGRAAVSPDGNLYGFIDTEGNMVIDPIYEEAWNFEGGVAITIRLVAQGLTQVVTLDRYGESVLTTPVTGFFRWRDTRIAYNDPTSGAVGVNFHLMALLDDDGNMLTGFNFSDILDFHDGLAVASRPSNYTLYYGLINRHGATVIPTIFAGLAVDDNTIVVQSFDTDPDTGAVRSRVGILALPDDAATRQPDPEEWDADIV